LLLAVTIFLQSIKSIIIASSKDLIIDVSSIQTITNREELKGICEDVISQGLSLYSLLYAIVVVYWTLNLYPIKLVGLWFFTLKAHR